MKFNNSNKSFGLVIGIILLILFLYYYFKNEDLKIILIVSSSIFLILGYLNSSLLSPFNKIWIKLGYFLGKIIAPVVMMAIYFLIIYPTNIVLKLFNKDILNLKIDKNSDSFWTERKDKFNSMNKQF